MTDLYKNVFKMVLLSLVLPLFIGYMSQVLVQGVWVNVALHATLESASASIAIVLALAIYQIQDKGFIKAEYVNVVLAFLAMGIFDLFHAMTEPGNLFIWYHSLSVLLGGLFFAMAWLPSLFSFEQRLQYLASFILLILLGALLSIQYQDSLPVMRHAQGHFTQIAQWMNMLGGFAFILGGVFYLFKYLKYQQSEDLILFGGGMLFGAAGILFAISTLWDFQWFVWHFVRVLAFLVIMVAFYRFINRYVKQRVLAEKKAMAENTALANTLNLLKQYQTIVDETSIVSKGDLDGKITYVNERLVELTGYSRQELLGQSHNIFKSATSPQEVFVDMWDTLSAGKAWHGQVVNQKKNGEHFYVQMTIMPIKNAQGDIQEYIALRHDITQWKKDQDALTSLLITDKLTGLKNRSQLIRELESKAVKSLALLNVDDFKEVNDFLGVEKGDQVIQKVAEFLATNKAPQLKLFRVHGDEFALIERHDAPVQNFHEQIIHLTRHISDHAFMVADQDIFVSLSAGVAQADANLLATADMALREAKKSHKAVVNYAEVVVVSDQYKENLIWSRELKSALNEGRVIAVFQPVYNMQQEAIVSYECLVRLKTRGELVSPFYFLDIAKKTRLYADLTRTMLMHAFETFKDRTERFAVNLSAEDLGTPETLQYLQKLCHDYTAGERLTIEITESEGIENFEEATQFLQVIKQMGVKVAIDDYGTGYSNFEYLMRLQPDYIKLDGSLIRNMLQDPDKELIVETIVTFAQKRGIETIAEFVEDNATYIKLKLMGVDMVQGYFISPPLEKPQDNL